MAYTAKMQDIITKLGVPAVAQWYRWHLGNAGMQVQPPTQHGGLRNIWHCCGNRSQFCSLDLIPGLETPYTTGQPKKKKKTKLKINRVLKWHAEIGQATNIFASIVENHFVTKILNDNIYLMHKMFLYTHTESYLIPINSLR